MTAKSLHLFPELIPVWPKLRRISFALTIRQFIDCSKDVTRRKGWKNLQSGDYLLAVDQVMGIPKGGHSTVYGIIRVISVRSEPLNAITDEDVVREGFPGRDADWFVAFFRKMGGPAEQIVQRIEFERIYRFDDGQEVVLLPHNPALTRELGTCYCCPVCNRDGILTTEMTDSELEFCQEESKHHQDALKLGDWIWDGRPYVCPHCGCMGHCEAGEDHAYLSENLDTVDVLLFKPKEWS